MKKSDVIISDFYQRQKQFGCFQSISLHRNINEPSCSGYFVNIVLCGNPSCVGDRKLILKFYGVRDFKMGNLDIMFNLLINIIDISDRQMEGIRYRVKEDENELFSFYCDTFELEESANDIQSI